MRESVDKSRRLLSGQFVTWNQPLTQSTVLIAVVLIFRPHRPTVYVPAVPGTADDAVAKGVSVVVAVDVW
jgi:hypothetical protein